MLSIDIEEGPDPSLDIVVHGYVCIELFSSRKVSPELFLSVMLRLFSVSFGQFLVLNWFWLNRWSINTKYYSADVSVWMAHLCDDFDAQSLPILGKLDALVMVFDLSKVSLRLIFVPIQSKIFYFSSLGDLLNQVLYYHDSLCVGVDELIILCALICSHHPLLHYRNGSLRMILRILRYCCALGIK